jgi:hypothetical protein
MWLVYEDADHNRHYQHWSELMWVGTLIDPETGDDMEIVGWRTDVNE